VPFSFARHAARLEDLYGVPVGLANPFTLGKENEPMDIGEDDEIIIVEPLEDPVPRRHEIEPQRNDPAPVPISVPEREREKVPA
jgi:hypothetical protein